MAVRPTNHLIMPLFLLEVAATACLAVIFYYLKYLDNFPQRRYPLSCGDVQWISYPFYSTGSQLPLFLEDAALYSASFFIPAVTMIMMETIRWFLYEGEKKVVQTGWPNWKLYFFPRRMVRIVGTLLFGMLLTCVMTFTLKYMFAIPRPHFLQACQPNDTALFTACGGDIYIHAVTTNATFTPSSSICLAAEHRVEDALRSFPSEHAALPAFCGVFVASYLHQMVGFRTLVTVRPCLVALALIGAVTPGIGSLHAYHCRWEDILAGYILGAAIALYVTKMSLRGFADVRVATTLTSNLLSLSGAPVRSGFKSLPSVVSEEPDVRRPRSVDDLSIPRPRSNTAGNIYEASNNMLSGSDRRFSRFGPTPRKVY